MTGSRRFNSELLQKIKSAVNLIEVIGEHVVLRKSGGNYTGLCPFHSERTPSFSVSEAKQLYHCYGCKKSGDVITFIQELHGLDFPEAIEELADRAKVKLPAEWEQARYGAGSDDPEARKRREEQQKKLATMYKLNRFVAAFYHQQLKTAPFATAYFRKRGIGDELMRSFYLGAALPAWEALAAHLNSAKAPLPVAAELGLIRPSTKKTAVTGGTGYFDLFRNRAMFPILDLRGRVCGFGGRALPDSGSGGPGGGDDGPKYLNSPESVIFQKSRLAFGLFQAQKHIREKDEVILVEGYFDVLALHAAGFQNVVASCGTALTPEHLALFRKFASKVTLLFDGDKAGIAATERAMEIGLEHGAVLQGAFIPDGLDPDELLFDQDTGQPRPGGREQMAELLSRARPLIDVRLDRAVAEAAQDPEARTQALKRVAAWLSKYTDRVGREVRLQYVEDRMGITRDLLMAAMGSPGAYSSKRPGPSSAAYESRAAARSLPARQGVRPARRGSAQPGPAERILLQALSRGGGLARMVLEAGERLPPEMRLEELFESASAREFAEFWFSRLQQSGAGRGAEPPFVDASVLTMLAPENPIRSILAEALLGSSEPESVSERNRGEDSELTTERIHAALERRIAHSWARFSQRIKAALAEAEVKKDAGLQAKLMKEYLDVQRKMKEFTSFYDEA